MALSLFHDDLFDSALRGWPFVGGELGALARSNRRGEGNALARGIAMDVKETDKEYDIKADIPGVDKKDIKISLDGDVLSISVQREDAKEENKDQNGVKWHRSERSSFFASRSLRLPENADAANLKAKYENGVLHLPIPKVQKEEPKTQSINVE